MQLELNRVDVERLLILVGHVKSKQMQHIFDELLDELGGEPDWNKAVFTDVDNVVRDIMLIDIEVEEIKDGQ